MDNLQLGDKLICIDPVHTLKRGEVYTFQCYRDDRIKLIGYGGYSFYPKRFIPHSTTKKNFAKWISEIKP